MKCFVWIFKSNNIIQKAAKTPKKLLKRKNNAELSFWVFLIFIVMKDISVKTFNSQQSQNGSSLFFILATETSLVISIALIWEY